MLCRAINLFSLYVPVFGGGRPAVASNPCLAYRALPADKAIHWYFEVNIWLLLIQWC